uniref:DDE-1 domain-containing protein n=2 Tax=Palpitomonas bilix TaxID=652834 RepID=A0A7S3G1J3_9EUKA
MNTAFKAENVGGGDEDQALRFLHHDWPYWCSAVDYDPSRVFAFDEAALIVRQTKEGILSHDGIDLRGRKHAGERITLGTCVSCSGDFDTPVFIGRAVRPTSTTSSSAAAKPTKMGGIPLVDDIGGERASGQSSLDVPHSANSPSLPPYYGFQQETSHMTVEIFQSYLKLLNKSMRARHKFIVLLVRTTPYHKIDGMDVKNDLSNIWVVFFPANTVSLLHPCQAGIVAAVKRIYKTILLTLSDKSGLDKPIVRQQPNALMSAAIQSGLLSLETSLGILADVYKEMAGEKKYADIAKDSWMKAGLQMEYARSMHEAREGQYDIDFSPSFAEWVDRSKMSTQREIDPSLMHKDHPSRSETHYVSYAELLLVHDEKKRDSVETLVEAERIIPVSDVPVIYPSLDYDADEDVIDALLARLKREIAGAEDELPQPTGEGEGSGGSGAGNILESVQLNVALSAISIITSLLSRTTDSYRSFDSTEKELRRFHSYLIEDRLNKAASRGRSLQRAVPPMQVASMQAHTILQ